MRRHPWLCCMLLVFGVATSTQAGEYRTAETESLRITIDSEWGARTAPGYVPVRFEITNLGDARTIEIVGQGSRFSRAARSGRHYVANIDLRQAVRLARGDRVRLTIPVPVLADNENIRFEIREDGRTIERFNFSGFQSGSVAADAAVLLVVDPASELGKVASGWARNMATTVTGTTTSFTIAGSHVTGAGSPSASLTVRGSRLPPTDFLLTPSRLPTNWLGFTSLRAVLIGPTEWKQLDDVQKSALLTWTACGGDLMFVDGDLASLFPAGQVPSLSPGRSARGYFFGRIHLPTSASVSATGLGNLLTEAGNLQDANWSLPANGARDWGTMAARGFRLLIPGVAGVPARAYLFILILFSILIGPVNYWLLWRKRQQILLVLTTPLISAVFIVLLAGYVIAGEGFRVYARAVSFTMLDQVRSQASTRASVSLYAAGMTPGGGLRFARDTAIFPIGTDGAGSQERQTLDLTDSQRFAAGVIEARSPSNFEQIQFKPARERLNFSTGANGITVVNGLGAAVTALLYRDGDKVYRLATSLPPGEKAILQLGGLDAGRVVPADLPLTSRFVHLIENQPPGSYLAVLERSPFWDPGVASIVERGSFHLVIGWPEGQP